MKTTKTESLYHYISDTLDLIEKGYTNKDQAIEFLGKLEKEFPDKSVLYSYSSYFKPQHFYYWEKFLFNTQEDIVSFLKEAAKNSWHNHRLNNILINKFLDFPTDIKIQFYQQNLTESRVSTPSKREFSSLCDKGFMNLHPNYSFHNLPTFALLSGRFDVDYELFEKICLDYQNTLGLSHSEFLDRFGHTLVHCLDREDIKKYWNMLEMNQRQDLQESYAFSFFKHNKLKNELFLSEVDKNIIPHDLKLFNTNNYLMKHVIKNSFNYLPNLLESNVTDITQFSQALNNAKDKLTKIKTTYDLYFLDDADIDNFVNHHLTLLSEKFSKQTYYGKGDLKREIHTAILNFQMEIKDVLKQRDAQTDKKLKI